MRRHKARCQTHAWHEGCGPARWLLEGLLLTLAMRTKSGPPLSEGAKSSQELTSGPMGKPASLQGPKPPASGSVPCI